MMTDLENISVSNRAWNFHCFRVFALGKVNLRGYIVAGEWSQMKFETKWGNKAKFIKTAQTSHICSSPPLKSNQMEICEFHPTAAACHLSDTICAIHHKH